MIRGSCLIALLALTLPLFAHADGVPGGGLRKTIAVGGFDSAAESPTSGDGLSAMLVTALLKDSHFIVVERQAMPQLQWDQQAGQSGATVSGTSPQAGQLIGASVLVRGTVTKFDPHSGGGGVSLGGLGLFGRGDAGGVGITGQTATVEIKLRFIDTSTGRIIAGGSATGSASATGFDASFYQSRGLPFGVNGFSETPLGQASQKAIDNAVAKIDQAMEQVPWMSSIVENTGDEIYVAGGADENMQASTMLHVYRKVRDLTDPATGAVLETVTSTVGMIRMREVHDKVSVASYVDGSPPARGDIVKLN